MKKPSRYQRDFLITLTQKELALRYRFTWLGFFWAVINPVLQILTLGVIFKTFTKIDIEHYFLFLFVGLVPWNFFSQSVRQTTSVIIDQRQLLTKANFPKEILIFSLVLVNLAHLLVAFIVAAPLMIASYQLILTRIVLLILALIWLLLLTCGLSLFTSALAVYYRDINFIVKNTLPLWFYLTPVLYTLDMAPQELQILLYLNPIAGVIELMRYSWSVSSGLSLGLVGVNLIISILILGFGWSVFKKYKPYFVDKL